MSMNPYYSVVLGVKIPQNYFTGISWYEDMFLPYVEGHKGVEMSITRGENNDNVYLGKTLVRFGPYESFEDKPLEIEPEAQDRVRAWLKETFGIDDPPRMMLVCVWM